MWQRRAKAIHRLFHGFLKDTAVRRIKTKLSHSWSWKILTHELPAKIHSHFPNLDLYKVRATSTTSELLPRSMPWWGNLVPSSGNLPQDLASNPFASTDLQFFICNLRGLSLVGVGEGLAKHWRISRILSPRQELSADTPLVTFTPFPNTLFGSSINPNQKPVR